MAGFVTLDEYFSLRKRGAQIHQLGLYSSTALRIQLYPSWHKDDNGISMVLNTVLVPNSEERSGKHWKHCRMRRKGAEGQTKYRSEGLCTLPRQCVRVPSNTASQN